MCEKVKQRCARHKKKIDIEYVEINIVMSRMSNTLDGIDSKLDLVKENISKLEDIAIEIIQNKTKGEKKIFKK